MAVLLRSRRAVRSGNPKLRSSKLSPPASRLRKEHIAGVVLPRGGSRDAHASRIKKETSQPIVYGLTQPVPALRISPLYYKRQEGLDSFTDKITQLPVTTLTLFAFVHSFFGGVPDAMYAYRLADLSPSSAAPPDLSGAVSHHFFHPHSLHQNREKWNGNPACKGLVLLGNHVQW